MKKRLLSIALSLVMCLSLLPTAGAVEVPKDKAYFDGAGNYHVDGVNYYKVSQNQLKDYQYDYDLYRDMLTAPYDGRRSIVEDWYRLAVWIGSQHASTNAPYQILRKAAYFRWDEKDVDFINDQWNSKTNHEVVDFQHETEHSKTKYKTYTTGLQLASSVADAESRMRAFARDVYEKTGGDDNWSWETSDLSNDTKQQPVYYMMVRGGRVEKGKSGHGPGLGIVFSDFKLTPIFPNQDDSNSKYKDDLVGEPEQTSEVYKTSTINDTASIATAEQTLENSTTAEVSSEYTKGNEFAWEEGIEVGSEWGVEVGPLNASQHLNLSLTSSQAVSESWSTGTSASDSTSVSSTVNVSMPPYTRVLLQTDSAKETHKESWTTPIALSYKVTMVDYSIDVEDGAEHHDHAQIIATFPKGTLVNEPGNARKSLEYRYNRSDVLQEPGLDWAGMINNSKDFKYYGYSGDVRIAVDSIINRAPMITHADNIISVVETTSQKVSGLSPLYPLTQIVPSNKVMEYNLDNGDYIYPQAIDIQGLNEKNAPFYGFDASKGSWILTDVEGNNISSTSEVAQLTEEPGTGNIKLVAGDTEGTVYLSYLIDEDYYQNIYKESAITNDNIETYRVPIHVTNTDLDNGSIEVAGTQSIVAGDPAVAPKLTYKVRNAQGKQVRSSVHWYANDLDNLVVNHDTFAAPKDLTPGAYPVVAYIGKTEKHPQVWSEPCQVQVLGARTLSELAIPASATLNPLNLKMDLNDVEVSAFDQYRNTEFDHNYNTAYPVSSVWTGNEEITWTCDNENVKIQNGVATFPQQNGVYTLNATAVNDQGDTVVSNDLTVTVTGFAESIQPEQNRMNYQGGPNVVTLTGPNLADGIEILALVNSEENVQIVDVAESQANEEGQQQAVVQFPANETGAAIEYLLQVSYDGYNIAQAPSATVTVAAKTGGGSSGGGSSGGGGGGSSSGGGGGGGGSAVASTYPIVIEEMDNGTVTSSHRSASKDTRVTLTVTPDQGYALENLTVTDSRGIKMKLNADGNQYTFNMPSSKVVAEASFVKTEAAAEPFTDVSADAYYHDAVLWAAENGITGGMTETTFAPNAGCSRAQAVTFLWRAAGSPAPQSEENPFTDVSADAYYHDAVLWAVENGVTNGKTETTFVPNAGCSRAQIITFLYRAEKSPAVSAELTFQDVAADAYFANAVVWAVENGITSGTTNDTFSPGAPCTRAQIVTFLYRAVK